jgi:chromosome segregation ATPase
MKMDGEYYRETQDTIMRLDAELRQAHGLCMRQHAELDQLLKFEVTANRSYAELAKKANGYAATIDTLTAERDALRANIASVADLLNTYCREHGCEEATADTESIKHGIDRLAMRCVIIRQERDALLAKVEELEEELAQWQEVGGKH